MKNTVWEPKYRQIVEKVKINLSHIVVCITVKLNFLPRASSCLACALTCLTHLRHLLGFQFVSCHWEMTHESSGTLNA